MKKYFLLINVIVGFGCNQTVNDVEVIPPSKMIELLIDIHILEARVDKLRITNDSSFAVFNTLEKEIFDLNDITKEEYERSFQHYLARPRELDQIYSVVVDSLNLIQKRGYQKESELAQVADFKPSLDSLAVNNRMMNSPSISKDSLFKK
ncbi:DUF4296 domain-containing protein [Reichenbachiella sp.]|uniref:DUF4296 domain-containing protein n=1 Tax=Reichenbachiella sp. TaxID=2184521 RepID=UPI003B59F556